MSNFSHLECSACAATFDPHQVQTFCTACQAPLLARYDLKQARSALSREQVSARPDGQWRWHELLPVFDAAQQVSLGEGDTPLLPLRRLGAELGLPRLSVKDESVNPTGSFKARGLAVAVAKARELCQNKLIIPTAGNAGGALAAYAARAGLQAQVIMPRDAPQSNVDECRAAGAEVVLVDGLISDAGGLAAERSRSQGWFDVSTFKEPYRLEGKKVMGYELAEALGWRLPDVILYPTGGGTGLVGMWKAFSELEELGWLENSARPRLVSVQAEGCAPVVRAMESGAEMCTFWERAETIASGLRVPKSFADRLILRCLRESRGTAVAVNDAAIRAAQKRLAELEGVLAAPEGAATLAGLEELVRRGWVGPDDRIVLFNTGSGLKYVDLLQGGSPV
jgi:threonine synthase